MEPNVIEEELKQLKKRLSEIESQKAEDAPPDAWAPTGHYAYYEAAAGFMLGIFGSVVSLVVNVIGSVLAGLDPLQLIRIYLTFPLGEQALKLSEAGGETQTVPDGLILALGCCLYLGTGMLLGVPVFFAVSRISKGKSLLERMSVAISVSLAIWAFNFYAILSNVLADCQAPDILVETTGIAKGPVNWLLNKTGCKASGAARTTSNATL